MREYHATLNLTFEARDEDEASEIVNLCKSLLRDRRPTVNPYKVEVEADKLEVA